MKGYKEVRYSVIEFLKSQMIEYKIEDIENGFQIDIKEYPYVFKISGIEELGWNVFLQINECIFVEHPETDKVYSSLENIIDEINYKFYGLDENITPIIYDSRCKLNQVIDKYSDLIDSVEDKELKTVIKFKEINQKCPIMHINYSISLGVWTLRIEDFFKNTNIHDELFTIFREVKSLLQKFNNEKDVLSLF